jgi:DNA-binding Lrp family transcriptional regulator
MGKVRHQLSETDSRIAAALMASPRASWRTVARALGISERTVVRRATALFGDGTLRATAVRNPALFPDLITLALRIRCQPNRIKAIAANLARRSDTIWVDVLGGGDEICTVLQLESPDARNTLLLRDLPATPAVQSWTSHVLLRVFPAGFDWSGGLLSEAELTDLRAHPGAQPAGPGSPPVNDPLISALIDDARASYTDLARRINTTSVTARRRVEALVSGQFVRLATEVDLARLGIRAEALLWINVAPGGLEETGE